MSLSQNRLLSALKDRRLHVLLVVLLVIGVYLISSRPNKERLVGKLNSQIREGKFEDIYDDAWDNLHLNVNKEEFIRRMRDVASKLKAIDADLNFQRDRETEHEMHFAGEGPETLTVYQRLGKDERSALVTFVWTSEGEFMDIHVLPASGMSDENYVHGVGYQRLYKNGQLVK